MEKIEFEGWPCPKCKKGTVRPIAINNGGNITVPSPTRFKCDNEDCDYETKTFTGE